MTDLRNFTYTYFRRARQPRWQTPEAWQNSSVLELGAGISPVASSSTRGFYLAIDIAHPHRCMPFAYVQSDAAKIALQDKSFDYFVSISMLEHVARPSEILAELNRVCRRGGVVSVPALDNFSLIYDPVNWVRLRLGLPVMNYGIGGFGHLCVLTNADWKKMFEQAGFNVVEASPAPVMDIFETLEFSLLSTLFSHHEYNELLHRLHSREGRSSSRPGFLKQALSSFFPVLKRLWKALCQLNIPAPGSVSTYFTLECRR